VNGLIPTDDVVVDVELEEEFLVDDDVASPTSVYVDGRPLPMPARLRRVAGRYDLELAEGD
jgi:hypothetical protein